MLRFDGGLLMSGFGRETMVPKAEIPFVGIGLAILGPIALAILLAL